MTVSVRPWEEIAADLREFADYMPKGPLLEAAVAGDALAAEVARLRDLFEVMLTDGQILRAELSALTAVVAAVHAALDQYDKDLQSRKLRNHPGVAALVCVSAIAKAVER